MEVRRFLNRLLGLPLGVQNALFELYAAALHGVLAAARKDGTYDEGIADLSGAAVSVHEPEARVWADPATGAEMRAVLLRVDRGVSWEAACAKLDARLGDARRDDPRRDDPRCDGPRRDGPRRDDAAGRACAAGRESDEMGHI